MKLKLATCQFPSSDDVQSNYRHVSGLLRDARAAGAAVAHFPEACLSGYAGADCESLDGIDWELLRECTLKIVELAGEVGIWVVLGSTHRLSEPNKPHNSLYVIDHRGRLVDRYDKRFCAGDLSEETGELAHYTPGDHFSLFEIEGVRCGTLICHEYRYPELYREYKRRGVQLMFHSFHAAHLSPERFDLMQAEVGKEHHAVSRGSTYPEITMPASMIAAAASSHIWISCPNSSARESCWGSFFVRADGVITGQLGRHETGLLLSTLDTDAELYDSTVAWRHRALDGVFHSGSQVRDERSRRRNKI